MDGACEQPIPATTRATMILSFQFFLRDETPFVASSHLVYGPETLHVPGLLQGALSIVSRSAYPWDRYLTEPKGE